MNCLLKNTVIILLLLLTACVDGGDSQVSGGKFTVHFENVDDKEIAKELVQFWKINGLITEKKQDVKLIRTKKGYDLLLISPTRKSFDELTFEEIKSLTVLQSQLRSELFKKKKVDLVIADDNFKPLFKPQL